MLLQPSFREEEPKICNSIVVRTAGNNLAHLNFNNIFWYCGEYWSNFGAFDLRSWDVNISLYAEMQYVLTKKLILVYIIIFHKFLKHGIIF